MTPAVAAWRLGCSVILGGCLGLFYGFLRPVGRRHRLLADVTFALGAELRTVAPAGMDRILGRIGLCFSFFSASLEKIFGNYKNFVCICGKMGYNKVYENL